MAKMIPSILSNEIKSNGEIKIFKLFQDAPGTENWVVIHSLGLCNHRTLLYGELDFFVIAPGLGIFSLEVKGGRVKYDRDTGVWSFTNKYGETTEKTRSPFRQANEGMFSLMDDVKAKFGSSDTLSKLLYGTGVMFPDIDFDATGTEGEQWQVFDRRNNGDVVSYIKNLSKHFKEKWKEKMGFFDNAMLPNKQDAKRLTEMLRGDVDKHVPLASSIDYSEHALIDLTQEQFSCLDGLEFNPRCLILGAAGTGKTLLAVEETERAAASGQNVAYLCYNRLLADWLKNYFKSQNKAHRPKYIGTIDSWMIHIIKTYSPKTKIPKQKDSNFYQEELPYLTITALENVDPIYDKIIIDEAQDIIMQDSVDVLNEVLKGGLSKGQWCIFGDFEHQAIYDKNTDPKTYMNRLHNLAQFTIYHLTVNCRNTKQIGNTIKDLTGFESKMYLNNADGVQVEYRTYHSPDEQVEILEKLLEKLTKEEKLKPNQITILSPVRRENSVVSRLKKILVEDYRPGNENQVTFSTIQAFKGLENTVIILTDIETFSYEQLMYVGLSRARSCLYILESVNAKKERSKLKKEKVKID